MTAAIEQLSLTGPSVKRFQSEQMNMSEVIQQPISPSDRVLATIKRLRHWAKADFIRESVNEWFPSPMRLEPFDVENALVVLIEDGEIAERQFTTQRGKNTFYRAIVNGRRT
jgi:hypothetical protein